MSRAQDFVRHRNGVWIAPVAPQVHKTELVAEGGATADDALLWMQDVGVEAAQVFSLIRKFGGRALRRRWPNGLIYLCGAEFDDGSRLTWKLAEGAANA